MEHVTAAARSLTDGMSALGPHRHDDRLTDCACWRVRFAQYSFTPTVVVPFETGLETVEALGRRKLHEELTRHGPYTATESYEEFDAKWTAKVAALRVLHIKRL